jgi:hypothetical protein
MRLAVTAESVLENAVGFGNPLARKVESAFFDWADDSWREQPFRPTSGSVLHGTDELTASRFAGNC